MFEAHVMVIILIKGETFRFLQNHQTLLIITAVIVLMVTQWCGGQAQSNRIGLHLFIVFLSPCDEEQIREIIQRYIALSFNRYLSLVHLLLVYTEILMQHRILSPSHRMMESSIHLLYGINKLEIGSPWHRPTGTQTLIMEWNAVFRLSPSHGKSTVSVNTDT